VGWLLLHSLQHLSWQLLLRLATLPMHAASATRLQDEEPVVVQVYALALEQRGDLQGGVHRRTL